MSQPNLASPPPPPPRRGPSPLLFLGLILGTTSLFAYALERKSQTTTSTSKRLRASDTIKPGNWMGDQEGVEDPEVKRLKRVQEVRERQKREGEGQGSVVRRVGAVGGTEAAGGGWEAVRSPGVQPRHTLPDEFKGEIVRSSGREANPEPTKRLV